MTKHYISQKNIHFPTWMKQIIFTCFFEKKCEKIFDFPKSLKKLKVYRPAKKLIKEVYYWKIFQVFLRISMYFFDHPIYFGVETFPPKILLLELVGCWSPGWGKTKKKRN